MEACRPFLHLCICCACRNALNNPWKSGHFWSLLGHLIFQYFLVWMLSVPSGTCISHYWSWNPSDNPWKIKAVNLSKLESSPEPCVAQIIFTFLREPVGIELKNIWELISKGSLKEKLYKTAGPNSGRFSECRSAQVRASIRARKISYRSRKSGYIYICKISYNAK